MTEFLTLAEVLAIHDDQIGRFGGSGGVRDLTLLEAALFRPQTGYYPDLIAEAAALWESLAENGPFIDGNKRTALLRLLPRNQRRWTQTAKTRIRSSWDSTKTAISDLRILTHGCDAT